jgi:hypothetical protein
MNRFLLTVTALLLGAGAAPALAQAGSANLDSTIHRHLGFFVQMDIGPAYLGTSASSGSFDRKMSGGAGEFGVAIGGAVVEDLILAGHLWGFSAPSPTVKDHGGTVSTSGTLTLDLSGIGLNATYYFMPLNLYLSLTPSIATLTAKANGVKEETKNGFGLRAAVGKEWWVSDHWGLGLDGHLAFASNQAKGTGGPTWGTFALGVAFSATYN